jgi:hypothetical protein
MEECRTIWFNHVTERERERQETEKEILWEDKNWRTSAHEAL